MYQLYPCKANFFFSKNNRVSPCIAYDPPVLVLVTYPKEILSWTRTGTSSEVYHSVVSGGTMGVAPWESGEQIRADPHH